MIIRLKVLIVLMCLLISTVYSQKAPAPGELASAVSKNDKSLIETLILQGADPDQPDSGNEIPLLYAVESGRNELVKIILDAGADPDKPGSENLTALMRSVMMSRQDLVILLLSRGSDPNLIVDSGEEQSIPVSALSLALDRGEYDIAVILADAGASSLLLKRPVDGISDPLGLPELKVPLDARIWRNTAVLKSFAEEAGRTDWRNLRDRLDSGVPVDLRDSQGVTALMSAAWFGDVPSVSLLMQRGADPFDKDSKGRDAFCYAAASGETNTLGFLLKRITDIDNPDAESASPEKGSLFRSPLYFAVGNRNHEALNLLLSAGYSPDGPTSGSDEEGVTLLMMAAWLSDYYAVEKLLPLSNGGIMDDAGRRALDWSAAAFERDRTTGREVGSPGRGSRNYPVARLLAGRLRNPHIYATQPTQDLNPAVINAWNPGLTPGADMADDWRDKRPSPVPAAPGDGDLTLYRIFRDEEPGTPSG